MNIGGHAALQNGSGQNGSGQYTHSIFSPASARSSSTLDDEEYLRTNDDYSRQKQLQSTPSVSVPETRRLSDRLDSSIANNMTSQAMSPSTKTPLLDLETSYQNIKHKMPVNLQAPYPNKKKQFDMKRQQMAAIQIQRWYRRHCVRNRAGNAALKRLLENTKRDHEEGAMGYLQSGERSVEDRKKIREEKAKRARQQAIQVSVRCERVNKRYMKK